MLWSITAFKSAGDLIQRLEALNAETPLAWAPPWDIKNNVVTWHSFLGLLGFWVVCCCWPDCTVIRMPTNQEPKRPALDASATMHNACGEVLSQNTRWPQLAASLGTSPEHQGPSMTSKEPLEFRPPQKKKKNIFRIFRLLKRYESSRSCNQTKPLAFPASFAWKALFTRPQSCACSSWPMTSLGKITS